MDHDLTPTVHNFQNVPYDDDFNATFKVQYDDGTDVVWTSVSNLIGHVRVSESLASAKLFDLDLGTPEAGTLTIHADEADMRALFEAGGKAYYSVRATVLGDERTFISGYFKVKVFATFD